MSPLVSSLQRPAFHGPVVAYCFFLTRPLRKNRGSGRISKAFLLEHHARVTLFTDGEPRQHVAGPMLREFSGIRPFAA